MSKHHLRHDKTCLNCGSIVTERYCSHCGQENAEPRETFKHLVGHFIEDVTHYDSHVLASAKDLIFKPGFLTKQYNEGKRASYLNPIRMYIFISAVFFLVFFSGKKEPEQPAKSTVVNPYRQHLADSLRGLTKIKAKGSPADSIRSIIYTTLAGHLDTAKKKIDTTESLGAHLDGDFVMDITFSENKYNSLTTYNARQAKLPASKRDDWLTRYAIHKMIRLTRNSPNHEAKIAQNLEHNIPKIIFLLLPLFALYIGFFHSRKKYWYTQHIIFTLHVTSFVFIVFLLQNLVDTLVTSPNGFLVMIGIGLLIIYGYLAIALYKVYPQPVWLAFLKALLISLMGVITIVLTICIIMAAIFVFA
jgi:hypothetical protein